MEELTSPSAPGLPDSGAENTSNWEVDPDEMLAGLDLTDEDTSPDAAADQPGGEGADGESFTLKHLDEVKNVSREEVITLAQKGLDYDRIRTRLDQAASGADAQDPAARKRAEEAGAFISAFPEAAEKLRRNRATIPDEVWAKVRAGESLVAAYGSYETKKQAEENAAELTRLRAELAGRKRSRINEERSTGSLASDGGERPRDPILSGWNSV